MISYAQGRNHASKVGGPNRAKVDPFPSHPPSPTPIGCVLGYANSATLKIIELKFHFDGLSSPVETRERRGERESESERGGERKRDREAKKRGEERERKRERELEREREREWMCLLAYVVEYITHNVSVLSDPGRLQRRHRFVGCWGKQNNLLTIGFRHSVCGSGTGAGDQQPQEEWQFCGVSSLLHRAQSGSSHLRACWESNGDRSNNRYMYSDLGQSQLSFSANIFVSSLSTLKG